jgi:hypothetical protein
MLTESQKIAIEAAKKGEKPLIPPYVPPRTSRITDTQRGKLGSNAPEKVFDTGRIERKD